MYVFLDFYSIKLDVIDTAVVLDWCHLHEILFELFLKWHGGSLEYTNQPDTRITTNLTL